MLDSGANISVIGRGGEYLLKQASRRTSTATLIKTADGTMHVPNEVVDLSLTFMGKTRKILFHVLPSIQRPVILGINFWNAFGFVIQMDDDLYRKGVCALDETHTLEIQQKNLLTNVVNSFPYTQPGRLNYTSLIQHHIDTGDAAPVRQRPYVHSPYMHEMILEEIDRMIALDIIEPVANSSWCNPIIPVKKPSGKIRICLDAKKLNALTVKSAYPPQSMKRILAQLRGTAFLSAIDLQDAYYQIKLDEASRDKTSFSVISRGSYRYKRMPMGLCNSGATLCQLIDALFGTALEPFAFPYLDDFIVATDTFEKHLEILMKIADLLKGANLSISREKSRFCMTRLKYLGYLLDREGLRPDPDNIQPILKYPAPSTIREVRSLLGMCNWFRRFIPFFSDMSTPISDLLKKTNNRFRWTAEADASFQKLKQALVTAPVLSMPDYTVPFEIHCDASNVGIGAILTQETSEETMGRVIAYYSAKLNDAQRNYFTTEKECLAVLESIKHFRPYLEGTRFTVYTDHAALQWLRNVKEPAGRLARWAIQLQQYDFVIIHRKGKEMVVPDALSRSVSLLDVQLMVRLADAEYADQLKRLREGENIANHKVVNGLIHQSITRQNKSVWRILVPTNWIQEVLRENHDGPRAAHGGFHKTLRRVTSSYVWPNMVACVRRYVQECDICKGIKPVNATERTPMGEVRLPDTPWQTITLDYVGPLPLSKRRRNRWLLVVMDHFSKYVLLHPMTIASAEGTVKFLEERVCSQFGVPERVVSDNGSQFRSRIFHDFCDKYDIKWRPTPAYFPQANPTEAANKSVMNAIRTTIEGEYSHDAWDDQLHLVACALNTAVHNSTGFSPYMALFGSEMILHGSGHINGVDESTDSDSARKDRLARIHQTVERNLLRAHNASRVRYNLRSRHREHQVDEEVWYRNTKLSNAAEKYSAKLAHRYVRGHIMSRTGTHTYRVKSSNGRIQVLHASQFK